MVTVAIYNILNQLETSSNGSLRFLRDPQALSSTLASLGMLQPRAFGSLKPRRVLGLGLYTYYYALYVAMRRMWRFF